MAELPTTVEGIYEARFNKIEQWIREFHQQVDRLDAAYQQQRESFQRQLGEALDIEERAFNRMKYYIDDLRIVHKEDEDYV